MIHSRTILHIPTLVILICMGMIGITHGANVATNTVVPEVLQTPELSPSLEELLSQESFHVTVGSHPQIQKTTTLLVSCIDADLREEVLDFMENTLHLKDMYDEIMMPGGALSYLQVAYPEWSRTLEDIIKMSHVNQGIKRIIFLDHLECQAYKLLQPAYAHETREKQLASHKKNFEVLRKKVSKKFPTLQVYTLLMDGHGTILNIKE